MSVQHLLPLSHAGQRVARTLLVAVGAGIVVVATVSAALASLALP